MYRNKQHDDLIKNEVYDTSLNCTPSTIRRSDTERRDSGAAILAFETNTKKNWNTVAQNEAYEDIGEYSGTTTASCTSSTDSGVNISDNDEIPPLSPSRLHSFRPSIASTKTNTAVSSDYTNFYKNNKNTSQYNNKRINKDNNCIIINNNNKNRIFNGDNDVDHDDENDDIHSENFDNNKFKVLVDCGNGGNSTRYQTNQNIVESKNAINISQQPNLKTLASNDKKSLQHNEFNNLQQRPASPASSLSMSSISNSCDGSPPSKRHQCSGSPVVSIHSISSAIISSDSDSDLSSDSEGIHEKYVIKKLGTQVVYSPNDPNIPNINSGHTVLNQKVIANDNVSPLAPLAALAAIGDSMGAAHALGPISAAPQRPQIGSIALSNSTDVTFGDKHFYEGPVTIQQFLIDGRDKGNEANGKDNSTFAEENNAKDTRINSSGEKSSKLTKYILERKKLVIPGVLAFMVLLIVASILASSTLSDSKNTNNSHDDGDHECEGNGTLCLIERDVWRGQPQKNTLDKQILPLHRVVISHTASEPCESIKICAYRVRVIQEFHMNSMGWDDIGYNFLISSDGRVYVGRDWDFVGAHTLGYNYDSVGISFIGTYISTEPTEAQLEACQSLLQEGLRLKKLVPDYRLYGARQLIATESPGDMLYRRIKKWNHWSSEINLK